MMETNGSRRKRGWMNLKVVDIIKETHDTKTFVFHDGDEGGRVFDYEAGQYLTFRFDGIEAKPLVRSYTMSSSPNQKEICAITVKRVDHGIISNWLCDEVKVGDVLRARGPIGRFCFHASKFKPHLFMIGAGSGVTPFVSMVREYQSQLGSEGNPKAMTLLVAYRSTDDFICRKELIAAQENKSLDLHVTLTREERLKQGYMHGRPNGEMLEKIIRGRYQDATFMTCGPEEMMAAVKSFLLGKGVAEDHVHIESFL